MNNKNYKKLEDLKEPSLIGRQSEWEKFTEYLQQAYNGSPCFVVLKGEEGSGKTRLVRELDNLRKETFPDSLHISVTFEKDDERKPFLRIVQMVYQFHKTCGILSKEFHTGTPSSSLGYDFIDFAMSNYSIDNVENIFFDVETDLGLVYSSVSGYLRSHSRARNILLVIEEPQYLDRHSADFFVHFLGTLEENDKMMVVFCYHGDDSSGENGLQRVLPSMFRAGKIREIKLNPILARDIPKFVQSMIGNTNVKDELATNLYKITKGNAYRLQAFVQDIVKKNGVYEDKNQWVIKLDENFLYQIPKEVEDLLVQNFEKLGKYQKDILQWLSLAKRNLDIATISSATGLAEGQMPYVLDELLKERYLFERDGTYGITSEVVLSRVIESISEKDILKKYIQLAKLMEKEKNPEHYATIADYFLLGQDNKKALFYCLEAAQNLYNKGMFIEALTYYHKVLPVAQAIKKNALPQVLIALGFTCYRLAKYKEALDHFKEATNDASKEQENEIAKGKGLCLYAEHQYKQSYDILRSLQKKLPKTDEEILLVLLSIELERYRFNKAQTHFNELKPICSNSSVIKPLFLRSEASLAFYIGNWEDVNTKLDEALVLFQGYGQIKESLETSLIQAEYLYYTEGIKGPWEMLKNLEQNLENLGDRYLYFGYFYLKATLAAELNMWQQAHKYFEEIVTLGKELNNERIFGYGVLGRSFYKLTREKDAKEALKLAAKALGNGNNVGDNYLTSEAYHIMGKAYLKEQNLLSAQQYLDYSRKGWKGMGILWKNYRVNLSIARLFSYKKDPKKALMTLEKIIEVGKGTKDLHMLSDAYFEKGLLYKQYQKNERAVEYLQKATSMYKKQNRMMQLDIASKLSSS